MEECPMEDQKKEMREFAQFAKPVRQRNTRQETTMFVRGAHPTNLWEKTLENVDLFENQGQDNSQEEDALIFDHEDTSDDERGVSESESD